MLTTKHAATHFIVTSILVLSAGATNANKAHSIIANQSESERRAFLTSFIKNSGESCDSATKSFFQGFSKQREAFWNVRCRNGRAYLIKINDDATGSTKILDCGVLKAVGGGECFKKF